MKTSWLLLLAVVIPIWATPQWDTAVPGYSYEFPRDHFEHRRYKTEWWYYTGNVHTSDGQRFGFELTFFRVAGSFPQSVVNAETQTWRPDDIYLAHFALSDFGGKQFYHAERVNRAGPGIAGASWKENRIWNGNWQARWAASDGSQTLQAVTDKAGLQLAIRPVKPPVINGENGVSQKGPGPGNASHYVTFTRIRTSGTISWKGKRFLVEGTAWMDHEFFTEPNQSDLSGWDWFSIQLNNNEELMLYRLRKKNGQPDQYSAGTYVDAAGHSRFLRASDFEIIPGGSWHSPVSGTSYPTNWVINIPVLGIVLKEGTELSNQELFSRDSLTPTYWEGGIELTGTERGKPVRGVGYLEMTGYDKGVWLGAR